MQTRPTTMFSMMAGILALAAGGSATTELETPRRGKRSRGRSLGPELPSDGRLRRVRKEKYPGQATRYLIGAWQGDTTSIALHNEQVKKGLVTA